MLPRQTRTCLVLLLTGLWLGVSPVPPVTASDADHAIALAQRKIQRRAQHPAAYYQLGDAYMQKARETGDPSYLARAEEALRRSLSLAPQQGNVVRHLAYVFSARHAFKEAAAEALKAIELAPTDGQAYGVLGDAYLELGQYAQAEQAYQKMSERTQELSSYSRLAGFKTLQGDPPGAIADLERAILLGQVRGEARESLAWAQWQLGSEYWAIGRLAEAETWFQQALTTYPAYYRATASLAQVRAAQRRYDEAIALYQRALAVIPLPEYAAALGDVYAHLGQHDEAQKQYALVEYIGLLNSVNHSLYNRELATFYVDHDRQLDAALALAQKELESRRDIYAYDLLAWTLYKHGRFEEARTAITTALRLGTRDAKLFFHAGMIYHQLGERAPARDYLQRALDTNPHFHLLHTKVAVDTLSATRAFEEHVTPHTSPIPPSLTSTP